MLLCLGGLQSAPERAAEPNSQKAYFHNQSSKWVWLILNVEFEVFSFSVNGCFKKVITNIYLQNGLPRPTFFFPKGNWFLFSASHGI